MRKPRLFWKKIDRGHDQGFKTSVVINKNLVPLNP
jgi:hypothetical protein